MEGSLFAVVVAVVMVAGVIALISSLASTSPHNQIGEGGLTMDRSPPSAPQPGTAAAEAEAAEEIRQLVEAKSARREARGQAPLDVDAEVEALERGRERQVDPALRAEIRELVIARNERRARRGKAPLDVDTEVEREIREMT